MKKNKIQQPLLIKKLNKYFILSTFIPFMFFVTLCAFLFNSYYKNDIMEVTNGYIDSLASNASFYFNDLEYATLLPYFNKEIMNEIKDFSKKENLTFSEKTNIEKKLDDLLGSTRYIKNDFYSAILVNENNILYSNSYNSNYSVKKDFNWSDEHWYQEAIKNEGKTTLEPPHYPQYYNEITPKKVFSVIRTIRNIRTKEPYAVIKIDALSTTLDSIFSNVNLHVPNIIFITDEYSNLFFINNSKIDISKFLIINNQDNFEKVSLINENKNYSIKKNIPNTNLTLHILLDKKFIMLKSLRIFIIGILLYLIAFTIASIFNIKFNKRVSEPVNEIRRVLKEVQKGNLNISFVPQKKWELQQIGNSINDMIIELDKTIERKYIAELKYKDAEMKALESQIQPHFLFNTITSIISLLYKNERDLLEKSLYALCDLLRYVLKKEQEVSISEEFKFIEDYLLLQKNRFNNKFTYSISLDESISNIKIPKLLIQPFIENSIIHGIEPKIDIGHLDFFIKKKQSEIVIIIKDNGIGFDSKNKNFDKSIGIKNSIDRLKIKYPNSYVEIISELNSGCLILIHII